jgi:hypothetical protein
MTLAGGTQHKRVIRPALPSIDRKFLLKLLQLEIAAHPPQAAVLSFTLTAEAGQSSKVQLGLFAPQMPEPSRLDVTIARSKAIAGEDRVGSPVLEDTCRSGGFRIEGFSVSGVSAASKVHATHPGILRLHAESALEAESEGPVPRAAYDPHERQISPRRLGKKNDFFFADDVDCIRGGGQASGGHLTQKSFTHIHCRNLSFAQLRSTVLSCRSDARLRSPWPMQPEPTGTAARVLQVGHSQLFPQEFLLRQYKPEMQPHREGRCPPEVPIEARHHSYACA